MIGVSGVKKGESVLAKAQIHFMQLYSPHISKFQIQTRLHDLFFYIVSPVMLESHKAHVCIQVVRYTFL
jgi:hypothetical protein